MRETRLLMQYQIERLNNEPGDLNKRDGYDCKECKNRGWLFSVGENKTLTQRRCSCQKVRRALENLRQSGLGQNVSGFSFEKFKATEKWQEEIKEKAKCFCTDDESKWFYIGGQVGCGKTHICTAIAKHYIKNGYIVAYMVWCSHSKRLKALQNDADAYSEEMAKFKNADVLYIDDFLKVGSGETPTHGDIKLAFEIINHRLIGDYKATIISSEKTLDSLMDYDEATMSRIFQQAGEYKINIAADRQKNYRLKGI